MANPTWFIEQDYLASKLKQVQASGNTTYADTAALKTAIEAAGFTLFDHFTIYGAAERTSPNALFNATEYLEAKVKALNAPGSTTVWTIDTVAAAFAAAGASPWEHYQKWGASEGLNPSNAFDTSSYYEAKVAELNGKQSEKVWTVDEVKAAFTATGLSPVSHYLSVGTAEGLTVTPVPAAEQVTPDARDIGKTFTLTTAVDTFVGTEKNDILTGTTATLQAADTIIDQSTIDNDVLNLTLTSELGTANKAKIANIENINVSWDALGTAIVDASNITGATITINSSKLGFAGNATVTDAASNKIVAGSAVTASLNVTTGKDVVVEAGPAKTVSVTATNSANVNAATATSVTVAGFKTATVDASSATTLSLTDNAAVSTAADRWDATVKIGKNVTVTNGVEELTLNATDGVTATVDAIGEKLTVGGTGAVTLKSAALTGETVVNNVVGSLTVESTATGAQDVSKIAASEIVFSGAVGALVTAATGANLRAKIDLGTASFTTAAALAATKVVAGDNLKLTVTKNQTATTFTNVETVNLVAAAEQAASPTVTDLTFADLDAGTNTVKLSGTNDVAVTLGTAKVFDASALVGGLVYTQKAAHASAVTGGSADNTVIFKATAENVEYVGQAGKDAVTFATTTGEAVASLGDGVNTVTANALTTGVVTVLGGAGVDTISATGITTGKLNATLGAGKDVVTLGTALTTGVINLSLGADDDSVTINAAAATGTITVDFGEGSGDTLNVAGTTNLSAATVTLTGLETIKLAATGATFAANDLSGQSYAIKATGAIGVGAFTDVIKAVGTVAAGETIDLSGLVLDGTLAAGVGGAEIVGNAGNDIIKGTAGNDIISGNNGNDTITGGAGADNMTGGTGVDTYIIGNTDSGITVATADTITNFTVGTDKLSLGVAATSTNTTFNASSVADFAAAKLAADAAFLAGTTLEYYVVNDGTDTFVFVDNGADGVAAEQAIVLTGALALTTADIIA